MSYDILIFEPDAVTDEDFPQWWEQVSRWEEPRDYDTTEGSTPAIRAFYRDLIRAVPGAGIDLYGDEPPSRSDS